jgi:4-aminobutyrate aminotransferase
MTLTESSADLLRRDAAVIAQALHRETDLVVERALGSQLWTTDGRRYLDFASGIAVANVGHNHPKVVAAAKAQIDRAIHLADVVHYAVMIEAAEALARISPGRLGVSFFGNSGTEAVEGAIKLARYVTGRPGIIAFQGAFHGRTYGSLSLTTSKSKYRERYEPFLPAVYRAPYPNRYRCPLGVEGDRCAQACFSYLRDRVLVHELPPSQVAAVIIEPVLGEGGYVPAPPEFLRDLRALCDEHGILLICDGLRLSPGGRPHHTGAGGALALRRARDHFRRQPGQLRSSGRDPAGDGRGRPRGARGKAGP